MKKFNLDNLKISSFVTSIDENQVEGGAFAKTNYDYCDPTDATYCFVCPPKTQDVRQCVTYNCA